MSFQYPEKNDRGSPLAGFTLVELLIYAGILALLVATIVGTLLSLSSAYASIVSQRALDEGARDAFGRMVREIRDARSIDAASSVFDASPGQLSLNTADASGTPETVQFFVSSGSIHVRENGSDTGPLTPGNAQVDSLVFRSITTGNSQAVKIEMKLESGTSTAYRARSFYETALLRGTYVQ